MHADNLKVKVCCISSIQEARLAIQYGADALGLVGPMPSGPGTLKNEEIAAIVPHIPPPVASFLLTSETRPGAIVEHHQRVHTNTLQIVDALSEGSYSDIRKALPNVKLVQVIHVINEQSVDNALRLAESVDALLLDSGNPNLKVKELGGTGRIHDWSLSRRIVREARAPVFLAGGLNAQNVRQAIETVQPYGIDLCSGLRSKGALDEAKLAEFFGQVRAG